MGAYPLLTFTDARTKQEDIQLAQLKCELTIPVTHLVILNVGVYSKQLIFYKLFGFQLYQAAPRPF